MSWQSGIIIPDNSIFVGVLV